MKAFSPPGAQLPAMHRPLRGLAQLALRRLCAAALLTLMTVPLSQADASAKVTRSGKEISVSGNVQPPTVQAVERDLSAAGGKAINTLVVSSTGGDLKSMMALGHIIRARRLTLRVNGFCAAYCSAMLAPAAVNLVVPKGSFLVFTPLLARDNFADFGVSDRVGPALIAEQNAYWASLHVNPASIYAIAATIPTMKAALAAAGRSSAPVLVPSAAFLHKCLGVASVDMTAFSSADSRTWAHLGPHKRAVAYLIKSALVYDGATIARFDPPCLGK